MTAAVNVARMRADDRAAAVVPFVGALVDLTAKWGTGREQVNTYRGRVVAVGLVYGEGGMYALVLHTDTGRVLVIKMSRLLTIAAADVEDDDAVLCAGCGAAIRNPDIDPEVSACDGGGRLCPRCTRNSSPE